MQIDLTIVAPAPPEVFEIMVLGQRVRVEPEDLTDEMVAAITRAFGDNLAKYVTSCRADKANRLEREKQRLASTPSLPVGYPYPGR